MTESLFIKNWASPPGDTIQDALEELCMNQRDLAARLGVTPKHVNDLIKGRVNITADIAVRLEAVLGEPASFWMKRDADYRLALAQKETLEQAESDADWLQEIPYAEMARLGWVRKWTGAGEKVVEALRFFGVGSVDAWKEHTQSLCPAFRDTGTFERQLGAVAAWLRKAELTAHALNTAPFDKDKLNDSLSGIRALTAERDPQVFIPYLGELCGACGIAVAFVPAPRGCPVSGATRWLTKDKALLALSLRHKTNDHLWFSLFHELGHLIKHGKKLTLIEGIDGLDPDLEKEANEFAANLLIPPGCGYEQFEESLITPTSLRTFSSRIGVAPGIVVGRLQKDGVIPWQSTLNKLKVRYAWQEG
jgi:HTH-type transcriptional regulator / antitoxin HigA